jgi:hypothetical protein
VTADLHKCATPDCFRLVSASSLHCCGACALAAEGKYEIHESGPLGHSAWCDERAAERGPWLSPAQTVDMLIDGTITRRTQPGDWDFGAIFPRERPSWHG